jgi:hypothetical protein
MNIFKLYVLKLSILVLILGTTGCAALDPVKGAFVRQAKSSIQRAHQDAQFVICEALTIGEYKRTYGRTDESRAAYAAFCASTKPGDGLI